MSQLLVVLRLVEILALILLLHLLHLKLLHLLWILLLLMMLLVNRLLGDLELLELEVNLLIITCPCGRCM